MFNNDNVVLRNTEVFVAPDITHKRQLNVVSHTIYCKDDHTLLIVPVPNPNTIRFINLTKYPEIFSDLEHPFDPDYPYIQETWDENVTKEYTMGTYKPKMCKSIDDLLSLNQLEFGDIPKTLIDSLKRNYPTCGYIVLKLTPGLIRYYPIGYVHNLASKNQLFIPLKNHKRVTVYSYNTSSKHNNCKLYNRNNIAKIDAKLLRGFEFGKDSTTTSRNKFEFKNRTGTGAGNLGTARTALDIMLENDQLFDVVQFT